MDYDWHCEAQNEAEPAEIPPPDPHTGVKNELSTPDTVQRADASCGAAGHT